MIDKLFEIGLLYDFYSELLTPHQKDICRLYFEDNYTLGEIADETGISRQAVHDAVSKSEKSLRGYEEKNWGWRRDSSAGRKRSAGPERLSTG